MTTIERPPYIYGEILSRSIHKPQRSPLPPFGRFLSQGMTAGSFMTFLIVLIAILSYPSNGYDFLFMFVLPILLAGGMVFGLIEGFVIWGCTRLIQHRLNPVVRVGIGVVVSGIVFVVYWWILPASPYEEPPTFTSYLWSIGMSLTSATLIALVSGSSLQPWRELVRGAKPIPAQWRLLTGTTGLFLRVIVLFFLMEAIIATICTLQTNDRLQDAAFVFIALGHFAAAAMTVFARIKFWLLLPLALVLNLPSAYCLHHAIKHNEVVLSYVTIGYLALWAAFLLTRFNPTYGALAFFKEELRYYLID